MSIKDYLYSKLDKICEVEEHFSYFFNVLCDDYNADKIPVEVFLERFGLSNSVFDIMKFMGSFDNFEEISEFGRSFASNKPLQFKKMII